MLALYNQYPPFSGSQSSAPSRQETGTPLSPEIASRSRSFQSHILSGRENPLITQIGSSPFWLVGCVWPTFCTCGDPCRVCSIYSLGTGRFLRLEEALSRIWPDCVELLYLLYHFARPTRVLCICMPVDFLSQNSVLLNSCPQASPSHLISAQHRPRKAQKMARRERAAVDHVSDPKQQHNKQRPGLLMDCLGLCKNLHLKGIGQLTSSASDHSLSRYQHLSSPPLIFLAAA